MNEPGKRSDVGCAELLAALQAIADLDAHDSPEGCTEWGEADCFHKAQDIANNILAAKRNRLDSPCANAGEIVPSRNLLADVQALRE